jgi:aminoglycoside phosphotransferase (APT) family kinase protein
MELLVPRAGGAAPARLVVKRHLERPEAPVPARVRALREASALESLGPAGVPVPSLAGAHDAGSDLVVMARLDGTGGDRILAAARREPEPLARLSSLAGDALAGLARAQAPARDRDGLDFSREAVISRMRTEARGDAAACEAAGIARGAVRAALQAFEREVGESLPHATCWTHGDFWPGNVLVVATDAAGRPASIAVLDWEGLRPGFALEDAATWLEHVALALPAWLPLPRLRRAREAATSALLRACGEGVRATEVPRSIACAKALRLAARAPGLKRGGPSWRRAALTLRCELRLRELAR